MSAVDFEQATKHQLAAVMEAVLALRSGVEVRIVLHICRRQLESPSRACEDSFSDIGRALGYSTQTVRAALVNLERLQLVRYRQRQAIGESGAYVLTCLDRRHVTEISRGAGA